MIQRSRGHVGYLMVVALLVGELIGCGVSSPADGVQIEQTEQGYVVREGGTPVLFYQQTPKAKNGQYRRSNYVHPLYGPDDVVLTEDFPADHLHQRGIYWAWHQIYIGDRQIGDSWVMEDFSWQIEDVRVLEVDDSSEALRVHSFWISPNLTDAGGDPRPFVEETTAIRIHEERDGMRKIDFEIRLRALEENVRIGGSDNEKGYGGFSVRMRLPEGMQFTSRAGAVTPTVVALERGPWMDISGPLQEDGTTSGISILCHRSNPGYPQPWILREEGSMQNPVFPGSSPVRLPTDEPLVLRYRLIVHEGGADSIDLNHLQDAYNSEEPVL